ncbi:MAG: acetyl-CoA carboxylase, biotin carboxyl carrier protein [Omnitrophica bacterium RBG_13_46_9]|nr:MAG: acetyl-CoA carboxylase, biotin carboxyl carrier protein [Omnitrophica bacterium RBG_13_46_9]
MNIKKIEEVIRLMEKHDLAEISIEEEGVKIHLRKGPAGVMEKSVQLSPAVLTPAEQQISPLPIEKQAKNIVEIKSPMVGTFYRSPSPDAKPFVDIGSTISDGDILCIIEAMKLMNEIKSEVTGKIVDIIVENGEPVEFGQALFLVEPV